MSEREGERDERREWMPNSEFRISVKAKIFNEWVGGKRWCGVVFKVPLVVKHQNPLHFSISAPFQHFLKPSFSFFPSWRYVFLFFLSSLGTPTSTA